MSTAPVADDWLRRLAACPPADGPIPPGFERLIDDRYCLFFGSNRIFTTAYPFRLDDVEADIAEIRTLARDRGVTQLDWWIGPDTRPVDLADRLLALGAVEDDPSRAMVLGEEPPSVAGIEGRPVASLEELTTAARIAHEAFEDRAERLEAVLEDLPNHWENYEGKLQTTFLAFVDGEPVGAARSVYLESPVILFVSGSVLPSARGRGVYRALVRARWDDAVARGISTLLVFAGPMSRPILERVGFESLFEFRIFEDSL
jgi:GNAT superfamily N-acetyltransferase